MADYGTKVEVERERLVQTLTCPICGVEPGQSCFFGRGKSGNRIHQWSSHTGRYNAAVKAGLVPEMAGSRG